MIFPIITGAAPEGAVLVVEEDGVDGAGGSLFDLDFVANFLELLVYWGSSWILWRVHGRAGTSGMLALRSVQRVRTEVQKAQTSVSAS